MSAHVVTGAAGALGRALVASLCGDGHDVAAVVRNAAQAPALAELGAQPIIADLTSAGPWQAELAGAEVLWHTASPRLDPPVRPMAARRRRRTVGDIAAQLATTVGGRVVLASSALACGASGAAVPALGAIAAAAESSFPSDRTTVVRLGWPYHPESFLADLVRGLCQTRFRIVGDGDNRMPLISLEDAVAALRAAEAAGPGAWGAFEPDVPTQRELVETVCAAAGARRPDRLPARMAALSLGGTLAEALASDIDCAMPHLGGHGWAPARDWRADLLSVVGVAPAPG